MCVCAHEGGVEWARGKWWHIVMSITYFGINGALYWARDLVRVKVVM